MERKTKSTCWSRLSRAVAFVLFCLFAAPAAQAMLLELHFHWSATEMANNYLQEGSIVQVIAYNSKDYGNSDDVANQFVPYGETDDKVTTAQHGSSTVPGANGDKTDPRVFLADTVHEGHEILYTGAVKKYGDNDYDFYTQVYIDRDVYDTVYVRVFGAASFIPATPGENGNLIASYWDISDDIALELNPPYQFQSYTTNGMAVEKANYFEVIPEPATMGLLGLGGCALVAWRRRRVRRLEEDKR